VRTEGTDLKVNEAYPKHKPWVAESKGCCYEVW
jgi:hypothetical protein